MGWLGFSLCENGNEGENEVIIRSEERKGKGEWKGKWMSKGVLDVVHDEDFAFEGLYLWE